MKIPDQSIGYFCVQKYLILRKKQKKSLLQARIASLKVFFKFCEFFLVVDLNPFV